VQFVVNLMVPILIFY